MSAKEQTQHNDKTSAGPQVSQPEVQSPEILDQALHPAAIVQRVKVAPDTLSPREVLRLQRAVGNRAVSQLLKAKPYMLPIQAKLMVGPVGDHYEQEADRVSEQVVGQQPVVSSGQPAVQRQAEEEEEIQTKPLAASITPLIQRQEVPEEEEIQTKSLLQRQPEEEEVQTKPLLQRQADSSFEAGAEIEQQLAANQGGGAPLPADTRAFMEPRFGADFSGVRVHTGGESGRLNRQLSAQAFTHGQDIYMGEGKYDPSSAAGKRLLAHELTHVMQQQPATTQIGRQSIQRALIKEATRSFNTVGDRPHKDPIGDVGPNYPQIKDMTDRLMSTTHQESIIILRNTLTSWFSKSPEAEKKLKDVIRAFLLGQYATRLNKLDKDTTLKLAEKENKKKLYLEKDLEARDKLAALLAKGPSASETQAFLNYQGFAGLVPVTETQMQAEKAKGPRIDVRSTFIGGKILGSRVRAHLFIVYTDTNGKQIYFRGGPGHDGGTRADMGEYTPNTVDWDPSAPSITLLQGNAAKEKLDGLIEATGVITGMKVPYRAGSLTEEGENCNATAWTILTRAGIKPQKPGGTHPGWGHILGAKTTGKEKALPAPEDTTSPGTPKSIKGAADTSVQVYLDRDFVELGIKLPGGSPVELLAEYGGDRAKIRYQGSKIGFIHKDQLGLPPVAGRPFKLRGETTVHQIGSLAEIATLKGGTLVQVIDSGFKAGSGEGEAVRIRYIDLIDNEQHEGQVQDWDLEAIK